MLARGLSTPLTLALLRDTYQTGDDVSDLPDHPSTDTLEHHLIARVLPAAYTPRPGRPPPPYSEQQAHHTLTYLARQMGTERNLAWWHIPHWTPTTPRTLTTGLVFGLMYGIGIGLGNGTAVKISPRDVVTLWDGFVVGRGDWLAFGLASGLVVGPVVGLGLVVGLVFRRGVGLGVAAGLGAGYGFMFVFELGYGLASPLVSGLGLGIGVGLVYRVRGGEPRRFRIASCHGAVSSQVLTKALVIGQGGGLVIGLAYGLGYGHEAGLMIALMAGLMLGLTCVLSAMFLQGGTGEGNPLGPSEIWHNDRMTGLVAGLVAGLLTGLGIWIVSGLGFVFGLGVVLDLGIILGLGLGAGLGGLGLGIAVVLTYPTIWQTTLAWRRLRRSGHVLAVKLMPFLEDARERGVLRTVGGVYQFRHATLQDQLADQTTPDSVISRVS